MWCCARVRNVAAGVGLHPHCAVLPCSRVLPCLCHGHLFVCLVAAWFKYAQGVSTWGLLFYNAMTALPVSLLSGAALGELSTLSEFPYLMSPVRHSRTGLCAFLLCVLACVHVGVLTVHGHCGGLRVGRHHRDSSSECSALHCLASFSRTPLRCAPQSTLRLPPG